MNRSRKYNLEAVFSARNEASDTLAKVRKDIDDIADALQRLGALKSDPTIGLSGDKEAQASAKKTTSALKDVEGTYKARIRVDKDKGLKTLNKDKALLREMFDTNWKLKLDGKELLTRRAQLTRMGSELRNMFGRAYKISIDDSQSKIARKNAELLSKVLDSKIAATHTAKIEVDGLIKANAQVSGFERRLHSLAREWDVDISVDKNRTALSAAISVTQAFDGLQQKILTMGNAATQFSRGIYSVQQGLYAFRAALMVVGIAAAGPVVSGLTIVGSTLITLAGGFGLVAGAAAPLVKTYQDVKDAQDELGTANANLVSAEAELQAALKSGDKAAIRSAEQRVAAAQSEVDAIKKHISELQGRFGGAVGKIMQEVSALKREFTTAFTPAATELGKVAVVALRLARRTLPALGVAAHATVRSMQGAFAGLGKDFGRFGAIKSLARILRTMPRITGLWTRAIGRFGAAFLNIMAQSMPYVRQFSRFVNRLALDLLKWTNSQKGRQQLQRFFQSAGPVAKALWDAVRRIGAALLKWSTKNPQQVAHAIEALASAAIFAGKWLGRAVFWVIKMASQHPQLARVAVAMLAIGVAVSSLSPLIILVSAATRGLIRAFVMVRSAGVVSAAQVGARWLALRAVFVALGYWIITSLIKAYQHAVRVTQPTIAGLVQMHKQGSITTAQLWWNAARQIASSMISVIGGAFLRLFKMIDSMAGRLGDPFGLLTKAIEKYEGGLKGLSNTVRGSTNKAAQEFGQMEKSSSKSLGQLAKETKTNMGKAAKSTDMSTTDMKLAMRKHLMEGSKSGQNSLQQLMQKGGGFNKQLAGSTNADFKKIMASIDSNTKGAKTKGLANFLGLKNTGGKHMFDLQTKSTSESNKAKQGIQSATYAARQKGIQNLTELEEQGAVAMSMAQEKWVDTSWNASLQMQQAMNSILEAMGKFIEAAGIDMKKPGQFGLIGRKGGDLRGSAKNRGLVGKKGNQHVDKRARGGIDEFAMGGRAQPPVGGIAGGTTRVYGEVPGTTEFYVTDNPRYRKRNLEILRAANRHMSVPMGEGDPRGARRMAKGRIWSSGSGEGIYGPTNNSLWDKATLERANKIIENFKVAVNTYENHPPGYPQYAQSSIDSWDYAGRGTPIGYPSPHNEVKSFIESTLSHGLKWTLGEGDEGHSGSYRHVHATWEPNGAAGSGGFTGGSGAPSVDYDAMFERMVPKAPKIGQSIIANVAEALVKKGRSEVKEMLMKKVPGQPGTSPYSGGGNLDQWIKQGLVYGNAFDASSGNIEKMKSRAVQESGGNPMAVNDWDSNAAAGTPSKGLFQIIEPTWESYRKTYGADAGPFDSKWDDPVMSAAVASRYMKGEYGHIVGASGTGYAKGGVHKGLPISMPRRMENAFLAVADVLRNFTSKGEGLAVGDRGGVGSGRHPVAITNEAGPEAIVPLRRKTRQGRYALAVANRTYGVPGFAAGGIVKQGWNLVGDDGKLGIGGPAAGDVLKAAGLWGGVGVQIGPGSDVNATYSASGIGSARTTSGGSSSMNPQYQGTPVGFAMWAHEVGHMLGLGHGGSPDALMSNPVMAGDKPTSAEIAGAKQMWGGPVDMADSSGGRRSGSSGSGGGGSSRGGGGGLFSGSGGGGGGSSSSGRIQSRGSRGGSGSTGADAKEIAGRVERAVEQQTKRLEKKLNLQLSELKGNRADLKNQVPKLIGQFIKGSIDFTLENDPDTRRKVKAGQDRLAGVKRLAGRN